MEKVAPDFLKKAPHERLREDIAAVRKRFADPEFKGAFNMSNWVRGEVGWSYAAKRYVPEHADWCGTVACLGGWFECVGVTGFNDDPAHYGMNPKESDELFYEGWDDTLEQKLAQASKVADAIEARTKNKTKSLESWSPSLAFRK